MIASKRNCWIVAVGEPLPGDSSRLHRAGLLAETLSSRGNTVTWWTSTYDHFNRRNRFDGDHRMAVDENLSIELLYGPPYGRNVSLARIQNHRRVAESLRRRLRTEPAPDVILVAMPTLELARVCVDFGVERGVPIVVDLRDMWPDIFLDLPPRTLAPLARVGLDPLFRSLRRTLRKATSLWGITPEFVEWGLRSAGRTRGELDRSFWLAYPSLSPSEELPAAAFEFWKERGVATDSNLFRICYFGALSNKLDRATVTSAAKRLAGSPVQFVICGNGDEESKWRAEAGQNIVLPGWIGQSEIRALMQMCQMGLVPIRNRRDFVISIPNKAVEYMAGGLPILSCLTGSLSVLLEREECGIGYEEGNVDSLVQRVEELRGHPERLKTLAARATRLFQREFTSEKVYSEMAQALEQIANSRVLEAIAPRQPADQMKMLLDENSPDLPTSLG